jgi:putative hemolysin
MSEHDRRDGATLETGIRLGPFELRLARDDADVLAVQRLRYRVFYEEMKARPIGSMAAERRDFDEFDAVCDHLLVTDSNRSGESAVVGTYRLLRRSVAERHGRFYTAGEYDISKFLAVPGELVELGRSCVDMNYRAGTVVQALLRGLVAYVTMHDIRLMFGCASLHGIDPDELALPLSYLHHHLLAPEALRPRALPQLYVEMNRLPFEAVDPKAGAASLPPLIKGYARAGCRFGEGAVIDEQFNTTDVCVVLDMAAADDKYRARFGRDDEEALDPGNGP